MAKLVYSIMVTLDGYIAGPNQELDWAIVDEELHTFINERERLLGGFLYGRRTYEVMQAFWPTADADPSHPEFIREYARIWQKTPKIVFSKTLEHVEGNARLVSDNAAAEVRALKKQSGGDLGVGGADLAATFIREGLVDEYQLYVQPVLIGSGTPMFPELKDQVRLRLVEQHTFGSGVVYLRYEC